MNKLIIKRVKQTQEQSDAGPCDGCTFHHRRVGCTAPSLVFEFCINSYGGDREDNLVYDWCEDKEDE